MHDNGIEDIITKLYDMIQDARAMPFGADKCVVERDRVLDLLDEISNQLPGELKQSKTIVDSKQELIANAKQQAKTLVSKEAVVQEAQRQADEMVKAAQAKIKELKQVTNDYVDDALKRTEEAINGALSDVRDSRNRLHQMNAAPGRKPSATSPIIEDI